MKLFKSFFSDSRTIVTWRGFGISDGKTSPGQSQSLTDLLRKIVWKCFVWPGVLETLTYKSNTYLGLTSLKFFKGVLEPLKITVI